MRARQSYEFAFRFGAGVSILLGCVALLGPTYAALVALALWTLATLFVLPWLYVCAAKRGVRIPPWAYRGPFQ